MRQGKVVILPMILVAVLALAALVVGLFFVKDKPEEKSIFDFYTVQINISLNISVFLLFLLLRTISISHFFQT